ncbi:CAAX prenyl protease 1 homolog [Belonocnema kinseyi]|uniref:CAAX prenyl protease 1 homolog n=1 Tax=Belonocnema kinseyi TaxID=2817044 RepID=UPI00143D825E|nr:CAAX prenyl protease 1 homolog [Belonocnema kinseyi]
MKTFLDVVGENIRFEILGIIWILTLWELYLSLRQRKLMKRLEKVPDLLEGLMSQEVYSKSRVYALDKSSFDIFKTLFGTAFKTILILTFAYYHAWRWSVKINNKIGLGNRNEILNSCTCMLLTSIISFFIELPLDAYSTFVVEQKHGFNKQTPSFFIKDKLKQIAIMQVISLPIMSGIMWIIKNGGDHFVWYLWIFTVVMILIMMIVYPELIAPLFDKYSPLPEGDLREKIEALAASLNFPLYKLYIVEGSKRSSHSNAYMYGFHKSKRIVLFDTLVKEYYKPSEDDPIKDQGCENDEVVAVLAHELGHWKYNHVWKQLLFAQISILINFYSFGMLLHYRPMYVAFGFNHSQPILIGLIIVLMHILIPINELIGFLQTVCSRIFEFQADKFAKDLGYTESLKGALVKLQKDNLGFPVFDKLYSGYHHSHPPLLERLEALSKEDKVGKEGKEEKED